MLVLVLYFGYEFKIIPIRGISASWRSLWGHLFEMVIAFFHAEKSGLKFKQLVMSSLCYRWY
jgi:hypothetical protein